MVDVMKSIRRGLSQILTASKVKTSCCIMGTFSEYSGDFETELTREMIQMSKNAFIEDDDRIKRISGQIFQN
jgi:hypothetical protein